MIETNKIETNKCKNIKLFRKNNIQFITIRILTNYLEKSNPRLFNIAKIKYYASKFCNISTRRVKNTTHHKITKGLFSHNKDIKELEFKYKKVYNIYDKNNKFIRECVFNYIK